jgi:pyruvate dehydrogenase E2 component (dihydrolipoamide acetyltransferase)
MEEGTFLRWLKHDGEMVRPGDVLYELESDKATQEIEATDAGILRIPPDAPGPDTMVPVGALLGYLVSSAEDAAWVDAAVAAPASRNQGATLQIQAAPQPFVAAAEAAFPAGAACPRQRPVASPRARRVAEELGIDWTQLRGSGRNGRVREADVRQAARNESGRRGHAAISGPGERFVPVSSRRRAIAAHMLAGVHTTAPVTLTTRADATNLVSLRSQFKAARPQNHAPAYTDIALCLAAQVLRRHPILAGRWEEDRIVLPPDDGFHLALAVDAEDGLLAPVLRDVANTTLLQVAERSRELVERARQGKLSAAELHGGVFTVSNLGAYGIDAFTPIINYPQTAILGLGAIRREAAVMDDGGVLPRDQITLSLTFDHRVVDGAPAAAFLRDLRSALENPSAVLLAVRAVEAG